MLNLIKHMFLISTVLIILNINKQKSCLADERLWCYEHTKESTTCLLPNEWPKLYDECGEIKQSPIDLLYENSVYDSSLNNIKIQVLDNDGFKWESHKTKYTVRFITENNKKIQAAIDNKTYIFQEMHLHWPSEHTFDGSKCEVEFHLIFKKLHQSKFAVFGYCAYIHEEDNVELNGLIRASITNNHKETVNEFDIEKLFKLIDGDNDDKNTNNNNNNNNAISKELYRYDGSLTVPDCKEGITWFVYKNPKLTVSKAQLDQLLNFEYNGVKISYNARPVQKLNNRIIKRSWHIPTDEFIINSLQIRNKSNKINNLNENIFIISTFIFTLLFVSN